MAGAGCEIRDLADCPQHLPTVAQWMWDEWGSREGLPPEQSLRDCQGWMQRDGVPLGIVAVRGADILGCMCLHPRDLEERPDLTPWMACQYVLPQMRGRGVAMALSEALEAKARRLGFAKIYMWTEHNPVIYARYGYAPLFAAHYCGAPIMILGKDLT